MASAFASIARIAFDSADPLSIYQDLLDHLSAAAFGCDFRVLREHIALPFTYRTLSGEFTLTTEDDLKSYCVTLNKSLVHLGATDYIRIARNARYLDASRIEGFHYTHILNSGERMVAPYASYMVIEEYGAGWRVTSAAHAVETLSIPIAVPYTLADSPPAAGKFLPP
jgi:hypothetical protein